MGPANASDTVEAVRSTTARLMVAALPIPLASRQRSAIHRTVAEASAVKVTVAALRADRVASPPELTCAAPTKLISSASRLEPWVARMDCETDVERAEPNHDVNDVVACDWTTAPPTEASVSRAADW